MPAGQWIAAANSRRGAVSRAASKANIRLRRAARGGACHSLVNVQASSLKSRDQPLLAGHGRPLPGARRKGVGLRRFFVTMLLTQEDMAMRTTMDFSPLFRAGIGFDRVFNLLDQASRVTAADNWPPYDIIKTGDDSYRIVMAVAGFNRDELTLTDRPNLLVVTGVKKDEPNEGEVLHKGIAARDFERRFEMADHVKVASAVLDEGLLRIELRREVPDALKPRKIDIESDRGAAQSPKPTQLLEAKAA